MVGEVHTHTLLIKSSLSLSLSLFSRLSHGGDICSGHLSSRTHTFVCVCGEVRMC